MNQFDLYINSCSAVRVVSARVNRFKKNNNNIEIIVIGLLPLASKEEVVSSRALRQFEFVQLCRYHRVLILLIFISLDSP